MPIVVTNSHNCDVFQNCFKIKKIFLWKHLDFPIFFAFFFVVFQRIKYTSTFTITIQIQLYNFLYLISLVFSIFFEISSNKSGALINTSALSYNLVYTWVYNWVYTLRILNIFAKNSLVDVYPFCIELCNPFSLYIIILYFRVHF